MSKNLSDLAANGRAIIENDAIVIRLPIENLSAVVEGAWAAGGMDERWKVTAPKAFAAELVQQLNEESENGTTQIHRMFDRAIIRSVEYGAEGIELHEQQQS